MSIGVVGWYHHGDNHAILSDTFAGTVLDTAKWQTYIHASTGTVTQNDALLLELTGSAISNVSCFAIQTLPFSGILNLTVDWRPHKNHYASAAMPCIKIRSAGSSPTREGTYGLVSNDCFSIMLAEQYDTTTRSQLSVRGWSSSSWDGPVYGSGAISIGPSDTVFHTITLSLDAARNFVLKMDGTVIATGTLPSPVISGLGNPITVEFCNPNYGVTAAEEFKNFSMQNF